MLAILYWRKLCVDFFFAAHIIASIHALRGVCTVHNNGANDKRVVLVADLVGCIVFEFAPWLLWHVVDIFPLHRVADCFVAPDGLRCENLEARTFGKRSFCQGFK